LKVVAAVFVVPSETYAFKATAVASFVVAARTIATTTVVPLPSAPAETTTASTSRQIITYVIVMLLEIRKR